MSEATGVQFPRHDGRRSTQQTSREVFSAALAGVDDELATRILGEPDWRRRYPGHLRELTARAAASGAAASGIARAGLERLHAGFEFVDDGGTRPLMDAVAAPPATPLDTRVVAGARPRLGELVVPYRGEDLTGHRLVEQADDWVRRGIAEPSLVGALRAVVDEPSWLDLTGRTFAVLGAGAEMGPTAHLLAWGADVAAVDVPSTPVWDRLTALAEAGSGRLLVPVGADGRDGVDLLRRPAEVRDWIARLPGPVTLGNYAFTAGSGFVRLAMAADAVLVGVLRQRPETALAYLATPTDVFAVPHDAVEMSRSRQTGRAARLARRLTAGRGFVPNYLAPLITDDGRELGIVDSLIVQQGPNYALAKRLQRWRALVARQDGASSSVHVAPATLTRSVTANRVLAAAYAGAHHFDVEVFEPATARAVMSALLVHDLRRDEARATTAAATTVVGEHDLTDAAVHGGLWRTAWEPRSALPVAVLAGAGRLLHPR